MAHSLWILQPNGNIVKMGIVMMTEKGESNMIHRTWLERPTLKKVKCVHTNAEKYIVNHVLTPGKIYEVKNETEEFYFIIDNTGKIGGFYKDYFEEVQEAK
jgi:Family of unknown function (DUF6501)